MSYLLWLPILGFLSCSHKQINTTSAEIIRRPTSIEVDTEKSSLRLVKRKRFLLQVKNSSNQEIEISSNDVVVKNVDGKMAPFALERVGKVKYYIHPVNNEKELDISVQGKSVGKKIKINLRKPSEKFSHISIIQQFDHRLILQLKIADKFARPLDDGEIPEIVIEGDATIEGLKMIKEGLWEFSLDYPEHNLILYLSVRSQDVYLERLFRYQHVEK
jgi:hypothetical protein